MSSQNKLEEKMDEAFVKNAPFQIPENGRKALVQYSPIISLIFGILGLLAAWGLWGLGHTVNRSVDYINELNRAYGTPAANVPELGVMYYVALGALVVQALLLLFAYSGLKARSKSRGWNLLLFGTLANFVYGIFVTFTDQGSVGNLIFSLIGVVISLYLLAQIRSYYNGHKATAPSHSAQK